MLVRESFGEPLGLKFELVALWLAAHSGFSAQNGQNDGSAPFGPATDVDELQRSAGLESSDNLLASLD
jgi:hypothetical protein